MIEFQDRAAELEKTRIEIIEAEKSLDAAKAGMNRSFNIPLLH